MPPPTKNPGMYNRTESISRHMSRLLRHGPRAGEPALDLDLNDGGSAMIEKLLRCDTFGRMDVAQAEIISIPHEKDIDREKRFDIEATPDGPKILRHQGHTLPVVRKPDFRNRERHRYLIHATETEHAAEILRAGMKQMKNRQEFHFSELAYGDRQFQYIPNSRHIHSNRVWLVLDTQLASSIGYSFTKFDNGVVVCAGVDSQIHSSVFVSAWLSGIHRISVKELMAEGNKLVTIDHDALRPPPKRVFIQQTQESEPSIPETGKRGHSPSASPRLGPLSVSDYQPTSPTPSQLGLPELERPPILVPSGSIATTQAESFDTTFLCRRNVIAQAADTSPGAGHDRNSIYPAWGS